MATLLSGIRVLDLTTVLAGPFAAYQLSLLGADVIKIEIPGTGDVAREFGDDEQLKSASMGPSFLAQNSGKRSITLNLKGDGGRQVFARLLATSDVLIENMRPGVLERLGFSWTRMNEINPDLVYCALTGFGQDGPLAGRTAYDQIIQGFAGMASVTGLPTGDPLRVGFPICDTLGGYAAAMAICAALAQRTGEPKGAYLDVSMLETALTSMSWVVSEQLISGRDAARHGNDNAASSPSGTFRAGDGPLNIATNTQEQFESLCRACARPDLIRDERFTTRVERVRHRRELTKELESALASRSAAEWETLLADVSVPSGRLLDVAGALSQEHIRVRGLVHEVEVPASGGRRVKVLGSGVHVDGQTLSPSRPPPQLGAHTDEILAELGFSGDDVDALRGQGAV